MEKFLTRPWLRAFSGLSINLSAGWLLAAFIGPNVSFPENLKQFIVVVQDLTKNLLFEPVENYSKEDFSTRSRSLEEYFDNS